MGLNRSVSPHKTPMTMEAYTQKIIQRLTKEQKARPKPVHTLIHKETVRIAKEHTQNKDTKVLT